jgi:hypothetical protein
VLKIISSFLVLISFAGFSDSMAKERIRLKYNINDVKISIVKELP